MFTRCLYRHASDQLIFDLSDPFTTIKERRAHAHVSCRHVPRHRTFHQMALMSPQRTLDAKKERLSKCYDFASPS